MPYKRKGNKIYKKKNGEWVLVQTCENAKNAKAALRIRHRHEREEKEAKGRKHAEPGKAPLGG